MTLSTYLFFDGTCADAFDRYREIFGGEFTARMTFADGPEEFRGDAANQARIMHISLPIGDSVLMGSDTGPGQPVSHMGGFAVSYQPTDRAEADRAFGALSEGGQITMAMAKMFWGDYFGMCTDRFGVGWMVNCATSRP